LFADTDDAVFVCCVHVFDLDLMEQNWGNLTGHALTKAVDLP